MMISKVANYNRLHPNVWNQLREKTPQEYTSGRDTVYFGQENPAENIKPVKALSNKELWTALPDSQMMRKGLSYSQFKRTLMKLEEIAKRKQTTPALIEKLLEIIKADIPSDPFTLPVALNKANLLLGADLFANLNEFIRQKYLKELAIWTIGRINYENNQLNGLKELVSIKDNPFLPQDLRKTSKAALDYSITGEDDDPSFIKKAKYMRLGF